MQERVCAVYIMANKRNGTLYIGVTSDLFRRVFEHKEDVGAAFTRKYKCHMLVWYEVHDWYDGARQRERALKFWKRAWKIKTIEEMNPNWDDLYLSLA